MRTRALPRAMARLCLAALIVNLFAPIAWATLLPPGDVPQVLCTEPDAGTPAHHPAAPADQTDRGPHCPLCVLFGGTALAPPAGAPSIVDHAPASGPAPLATAALVAPALPATLRPSPRAPPL